MSEPIPVPVFLALIFGTLMIGAQIGMWMKGRWPWL